MIHTLFVHSHFVVCTFVFCCCSYCSHVRFALRFMGPRGRVPFWLKWPKWARSRSSAKMAAFPASAQGIFKGHDAAFSLLSYVPASRLRRFTRGRRCFACAPVSLLWRFTHGRTDAWTFAHIPVCRLRRFTRGRMSLCLRPCVQLLALHTRTLQPSLVFSRPAGGASREKA